MRSKVATESLHYINLLMLDKAEISKVILPAVMSPGSVDPICWDFTDKYNLKMKEYPGLPGYKFAKEGH